MSDTTAPNSCHFCGGCLSFLLLFNQISKPWVLRLKRPLQAAWPRLAYKALLPALLAGRCWYIDRFLLQRWQNPYVAYSIQFTIVCPFKILQRYILVGLKFQNLCKNNMETTCTTFGLPSRRVQQRQTYLLFLLLYWAQCQPQQKILFVCGSEFRQSTWRWRLMS